MNSALVRADIKPSKLSVMSHSLGGAVRFGRARAVGVLLGGLAAWGTLGCDGSVRDVRAGVAGSSGHEPTGDSGASSAGGGVVEHRPARPEWDSPLSPLAEPGWEQSTDPLCESQRGHMQSFGVWADARGVSTLYVSDCNALAGDNCIDSGGGSLQFNDGTGWQTQLQDVAGVLHVNGLPGAATVLTGTIAGKTGFHLVNAGQAELSYEFADVTASASFFGVGPTLGYARVDREVLRFERGSWSKVGTLDATVFDLSANRELVAVVGLDQMFMVKSESDPHFKQLPAVPAGQYMSVWGFAEGDLWAGNSVGQLVHFDGAEWHIVETGSKDTTGSGITALWGDAGVLYFTTFSEFGRLDEKGVKLLHRRATSNTAPFALASLWGRSKTEVFLTLQDARFDQYACGSSFIVWFDGSAFHQF